jgi:two-component system, chemotaxis family, chemotaxis protein CheY
VSTEDVDTALAHARANQPALVLLDLLLRGDHGSRFVEEYGRPECPVVVMTASQDPAEAARQLGAVGWLAKPFNLNDLFAIAAHHAPRLEGKP